MLKGMHDILKNLSSSPTFDNLKLDANTFRQILAENIVFVTKAFKNRLVIPDFEVFCKNITRLVKILISTWNNFYPWKEWWNTLGWLGYVFAHFLLFIALIGLFFCNQMALEKNDLITVYPNQIFIGSTNPVENS